MMRDFYEVLGVERTADTLAIKSAFRRLAHQFHPDKNPGNRQAEERFKEATQAYEVLTDRGLRERYDRLGPDGINGAARSRTQSAKDVFSEIFGDIFGRREGKTVREKGKDRSVELVLDFRTAIMGGERMVDVNRNERCESCRGTGAKPGSAPQLCHACGGTGGVRVQHSIISVHKLCAYCKGRGKVIGNPCLTCNGEGTSQSKQALRINLPPGTENGAILRFGGEGEPGLGGAPPGDLHVSVSVNPHPVFVREGEDLHIELPVTPADAILGLAVEVPTLDGRVRMRLPPGTQTGRVFRLRGKGVPKADGDRGDQHVRIFVETPQPSSERERQLMEELARVQQNASYPLRASFWKKFGG
ncbi:MAG: molecular chaperone DnaJ [Myxococcota bacterium]